MSNLWKQLNDLYVDAGTWSEQIYGKERQPLKHIPEEAKEAIAEPRDIMEYADIFLLLLDALYMIGYSPEFLILASQQKLKINKTREWLPPDENGIIRHKK